MSNATTAANGVTDLFKQQFAVFSLAQAVLIEQLEAEVAVAEKNGNNDPLNDLFWDMVSDLKGSLGANAANNCEDDGDQEEAISLVESWVADNTPSEVALILWMKGADDGATAIRQELAGDEQ